MNLRRDFHFMDVAWLASARERNAKLQTHVCTSIETLFKLIMHYDLKKLNTIFFNDLLDKFRTHTRKTIMPRTTKSSQTVEKKV